MIRVLHVLAPAAVGGLERVVQMVAISQAEAGCSVSVTGCLTHGSESAEFFGAFRNTPVEIHTIELLPRAWKAEAARVGELMSAWRPDVVHTHGYRSDVLAGHAARKAGFPHVATAHGFTQGGLKNRVYEWLQVASYRRGGQVIAVSRPLRDELARRGVADSRLHVVQNAWRQGDDPVAPDEARHALELQDGAPIVGWVGRLGYEKGPDLAIRAISGVPAARLVFLGDGAMRAELEEQASRDNVANRVAWRGQVPRAGRLLRAFDVLLLSSRTEGTPIILLEALAAGVPIVAADVGGVSDVVRHEREALLAPAGDADALARAVQSCLEDPAAARGRADAGVARLESDFGLDEWLGHHERIYRKAMRG